MLFVCLTLSISPEALGIVSGTAYLICSIFSQLLLAKTFEQVYFRSQNVLQ